MLRKPRSGLLLWRVHAERHVRPQGGAHEATHGPALVHLCVRMSIGASHLTPEFFDRKVLCPRRSGYWLSDIVTKRFAPAEAPCAARDSVSFARHDKRLRGLRLGATHPYFGMTGFPTKLRGTSPYMLRTRRCIPVKSRALRRLREDLPTNKESLASISLVV